MNDQARDRHAALKTVTDELAEKIANAKTNKTQKPNLPVETSGTPLSKKIPGFLGLLHQLTNLGRGLASIAQLKHLPRAPKASNAFSIIDVALSGINFISMPLIYFSALLAGEKPPFPISTPMKWAYSGVVFGLALAAILAPAVAGWPIALTGAGLGVATSLFFLGQDIYKRYKATREANALNSEIEAQTEALDNTLKNTEELLSQLEAPGLSDVQLTELQENIEKNNESMKQKLETIQQLNEHKQKNESILSELGASRFIGNTVGITLSLAAITGLVLMPFFPPAGLALLAATSITGGLLTVTPVCIKAGRFIYGTIEKLVGGQTSEPSPEAAEQTSTNNSTAQIMLALGNGMAKTNNASSALSNKSNIEITTNTNAVRINKINIDKINIEITTNDDDDEYLSSFVPSP